MKTAFDTVIPRSLMCQNVGISHKMIAVSACYLFDTFSLGIQFV